MPGIVLTRPDVDSRVGTALQQVNIALTRVEELRDGLLAYSDNEIIAMGYSQNEVDQLRAGLTDMDQLWKIYRGAQPLAVAKDFRDNIKKLWGLGF